MDSRFTVAQRLLLDRVPGARSASPGGTLELVAAAPDRPLLSESTVVEGKGVRARPIVGEASGAFAAFLDGTQRSTVVSYVGAIPVVGGTTAAVVRRRTNRRLTTWREPLVRRRLYLPKEYAPETWAVCLEAGFDCRDTSEPDQNGEVASLHPIALMERAVHLVQHDREELEQELAESWCGGECDPLYIDGGISKSERVATSSCAVGVIKSHRMLHVAGEGLTVVLGLPAGSRSSVLDIGARSRRTPVASWYLRVRDATGRDPLWGLVRVESALGGGDVSARADEISRWILSEIAPLALPDPRWDKMAYGVRDCEEYLRAIV